MARPKLFGGEQTKMVNFRMRVSLYKNLQEKDMNVSKLLNGLLAVYLSNAVEPESISGPARISESRRRGCLRWKVEETTFWKSCWFPYRTGSLHRVRVTS